MSVPVRTAATRGVRWWTRGMASGLLAAALATPAFAADVLRIEWKAPETLRPILEKHVPAPELATDAAGHERLQSFQRELQRTVVRIAQAEGYFTAAVHSRVEGEGAARRLVVEVTEGARTHIENVVIEFEGDIALSGEGREAQREEIRGAWSLGVGKPFRQADWDDAKSRTLEKLSERHYAAAAMADSAALIEAQAATATLKVILESGPRFTLGELVIEGLKRYPESLVRGYYRARPGDPYTLDALLDFQRTLQSAPFFSIAMVEIDRDAASPRNVPVRVRLVERDPYEVGLSLGYGTDEGPRGEVSWIHRNAFGRALEMRSALSVDRTRALGYADFHLPPLSLGGPFGDRPTTRDSFGVLAERRSNQGLDTSRVAVAAFRRFGIAGADYRVGLGFQFERKQPDGAEETIARSLAPLAEGTWRWVDAVLDPRRGGVLNVRVAGASEALLSTRDWVQAYALYQHWVPLWAADQLILRVEAGRTFATSREGIPEDYLFRAGGSRSNRGFAYEALGARDGDAIVGGRLLLTGTAEYVHWFNDEWAGALFMDFGDADDRREDLDANRSYGFGVRWKTGAGPLAFDLARPARDGSWRVSFSVSIAF